MGSFIGHAIPGSFFFIAGLWWTVAALYRYCRLGATQKGQFLSSPTYSIVRCKCGQVDVESVLAVIAASIGIFVEVFAACLIQGRPVGYTNMQHSTMYLVFGLAGAASIARPKLKQNLEDVDKLLYVFLTGAFLCEGLLFKFHLFGRADLDVTVHTLLLYTVWLSAIVTLGEMVWRSSLLLALGRGFFTILQGTWFWQVGFILYHPLKWQKPWNVEDHHQMMLAACIFTWHVAAIFIAILILGLFMSWVLSRSRQDRPLTLQNVLSRQPQYSSLANEVDDPFED